MSKPQKAAPPVAEVKKDAKKKEAAKTVKKTTFKVARKLTEDDKLPKQMKVLYDVLAGAGKGGLSKEDWVKELKGKIETRQPIERIIGYYQSRMESAGMIVIEKTEVPA